MESAKLLLLLLMFGSFFILIQNTSSTAKPGEEDTAKDDKNVKAVLKDISLIVCKNLKRVSKFAVIVAPLVDCTPGKLATGIVKLTHLGVTELNDKLCDNPSDKSTLKSQLQTLESTFARYRIDAKWYACAAVFGKAEQRINVAWREYSTMMNSILETNNEKVKRRHVDEFVKNYKTKSVLELHHNLKSSGPSFICKLNDTLAEHVNCHEKEIRSYADLVSILMFKGNMMNQFYYDAQDLLSDARLKEQVNLTHETASIMNNIYFDCVIHSMKYVKKDVEEVIEAHKTDDRQKLADDVWSRLNTEFDRYDWIVVADKAQKILNSHILTGFESVQKGKFNVSIARQMKGPQTKMKQITDTIASCLETSVSCSIASYLNVPISCSNVGKNLGKCEEEVDMGSRRVPVGDTYTAVHAWEKKAHQRYGGVTITGDDAALVANSAQSPFIYTGVCQAGLKKGKFVVMIKSEEEIMTKDPCNKQDCGGAERGKCVPASAGAPIGGERLGRF